jgi:hypothetical protein
MELTGQAAKRGAAALDEGKTLATPQMAYVLKN